MIKNNFSNKQRAFTLKTSSGFQVLCVAFLTSVRTILGLFLELFKTETPKLPIIYANIRV
ncbi:hypothetical protein CLV55_11079 [Flavobacterium aciduliphilum]|uniref:Uncharacterized protein n=1 Tax=Flavobacterium aciduliphilum TaxID=1101402 RepID=A0A328Y9T6_9FLAO|nr:hypothetical protein CLV55_11079 [Flavobacterium aciduliphilum]